MNTVQRERVERAQHRYDLAREAVHAAVDRQYREWKRPDSDPETLKRLTDEMREAQKVSDRRWAELERARRNYTVRRVKSGVYEVYVAGRLVGSCAHTGTHLDDYQWDATVEPGAAGPYPHTSAQASKRESVGWILATVEAAR